MIIVSIVNGTLQGQRDSTAKQDRTHLVVGCIQCTITQVFTAIRRAVRATVAVGLVVRVLGMVVIILLVVVVRMAEIVLVMVNVDQCTLIPKGRAVQEIGHELILPLGGKINRCIVIVVVLIGND